MQAANARLTDPLQGITPPSSTAGAAGDGLLAEGDAATQFQRFFREEAPAAQCGPGGGVRMSSGDAEVPPGLGEDEVSGIRASASREPVPLAVEGGLLSSSPQAAAACIRGRMALDRPGLLEQSAGRPRRSRRSGGGSQLAADNHGDAAGEANDDAEDDQDAAAGGLPVSWPPSHSFPRTMPPVRSWLLY